MQVELPGGFNVQISSTARCVLQSSDSPVVLASPVERQKEIGVHASILIVDDNAFIRRAIRLGFEGRNGFQVCGEAVDGSDAIEKARQLKPDLIILDFSMPVMNGLEAATVLHREMPTVPLILFTMHTAFVTSLEARSAGISAVVPKDQGSDGLVDQALSLLGLPSDR